MGIMNGRLSSSELQTRAEPQVATVRLWPVMLYFVASFLIFVSVMLQACVIVPDIREANRRNQQLFQDQDKHDKDIGAFRFKAMADQADIMVKTHQLGLEIDRLNRRARGD